ncbi:hypothetical protein GE107_25070 [Cohnella sp. CFH 77786]|uniref:hypothetical protein n=1 Tax=Cohnella sp. CFH 77786 TaxID=2662265 RepID=UPI001EB45A2D|nr:hypothetical protein [Cohnella sp. CFH 77786]MBW5449302.1 hypothetical protein [Cohnella sp. CFH 77786]
MTLHSIVKGGMDYILFTAFVMLALAGLMRFVRKSWLPSVDIRRLRPVMLIVAAITIVIMLCGWFLVQLSENREYKRTKVMLTSMAPILAYELSENGYAGIRLDTPSDDPVYLRLLEEMLRWMKLDPQVISFYTLRKLETVGTSLSWDPKRIITATAGFPAMWRRGFRSGKYTRNGFRSWRKRSGGERRFSPRSPKTRGESRSALLSRFTMLKGSFTASLESITTAGCF